VPKEIIKLAILEDLSPYGDLSTAFFSGESQTIQAQIIAKEEGLMAGGFLIEEILEGLSDFLRLPADFKVEGLVADGQSFAVGQALAKISGRADLILAGERSILNFLQRLTGIATETRKLVDLISGYPCKLLDTRKTMPGMRRLEKLAFKAGGGTNHRFNLSDMVMLKENHLAVIGEELVTSITSIRSHLDQLAKANRIKEKIKIEVEINADNLSKLESVCQSAVDVIMLDNFSAVEVKDLVQKIRQLNPEIKIEASGGINKENIVSYAATGVDFISTGSVFTKARNLDLSMLIL